MVDLVASGELGAFIASKGLVTWSRKDGYYDDSPWRGHLEYEGGGLLINQAIHTLDLMEYIGGKVIGIKGVVTNNTHENIEVEDTAMATFYYENGGVGSFYGTNSYGTNSNVELEFVFEKGQLRLLDQQLYLVKDGVSECLASDVFKKGEKSYWGMSHLYCIEDIYKAILGGLEPMVTIDDAIRATELVLGTYASSDMDEVFDMKKVVTTEETTT